MLVDKLKSNSSRHVYICNVIDSSHLVHIFEHICFEFDVTQCIFSLETSSKKAWVFFFSQRMNQLFLFSSCTVRFSSFSISFLLSFHVFSTIFFVSTSTKQVLVGVFSNRSGAPHALLLFSEFLDDPRRRRPSELPERLRPQSFSYRSEEQSS